MTIHSVNTLGMPNAANCELTREVSIQDSSFLQDKPEIKKIIEIKKFPNFYESGRTSFLQTSHPFAFPNSKQIVYFYKIKGAGAKTSKGELIRPTCYLMHNDNPHLGFNEQGNFEEKISTPSPIGGIIIERAEYEFFVAQELTKYGCPSILPLQVYKYTSNEMRCQYEADHCVTLGVVVSAWPGETYLRANSVFKYNLLSENERETLNSWIRNLNLEIEQYPRIALISTLGNLFGKTIRKFSEAGFYRYSGSPGNYSYCMENGEIFLIDLDSCLLQKDISPIRQSLEIMRDAASGLAYLLTYLTNPKNRENFPHEEVVKKNPFREILKGYYYDVHDKYIENVTKMVVNFYLKLCQRKFIEPPQLDKNFPEGRIPLEYAGAPKEIQEYAIYLSNSFMRPWVKRNELFSYLMPVCWYLHQKSGMITLTPEIMSRQKLFANIAKYSSPQLSHDIESELPPL